MNACGCDKDIVAMSRRDGSDVIKKCGEWFSGRTLLCEECEETAKRQFPQGWKYYPGDVCAHGVYVGGVGPDYMCPNCELGP